MMDSAEKALWDAYTASRSEADRNALVAQYLPFVNYLAGQMLSRLPKGVAVELDDLINDAIPALIGLFETYDITRSLKFITYASQRLRGAMLDAIRDRDWVPRLERVRSRHDPNHRVLRVMSLTTVPRPNSDDEFRGNADFRLPPVKTTRTRLDDDQFWREACRGLQKTDRLIVLMYYREGLTMRQIGRNLGISESRISQWMTSVIKRIKARTDVDNLKSA